MKKMGAPAREPPTADADGHLYIFGTSAARGKKQQAAADEIIKMESYLAGLMDLRRKHHDLAWSEAVVSATAKQIAKDRVRFSELYGSFPVSVRRE